MRRAAAPSVGVARGAGRGQVDREENPMGVFRFPIDVRFGACDPVGIVYFPRYFDWFHQAMEAWFGDALGLPYHQVLQRHGFPAVHTEADYQRPCAFGERVVVELRVGRIGGSSVRLDYRVVGPAGDGDVRATGHTVVVCFLSLIHI